VSVVQQILFGQLKGFGSCFVDDRAHGALILTAVHNGGNFCEIRRFIFASPFRRAEKWVSTGLNLSLI